MPTYQYACTSCGERLEVVQKFTDDPLTECPACQGRLRKVFSAVGVVFKGSGFYKTDSRTKSTSASSSTSSTGSTSGDGDGKSGDRTSGDGKSADAAKPAGGKAEPAAKSAPDKPSSSDRVA